MLVKKTLITITLAQCIIRALKLKLGAGARIFKKRWSSLSNSSGAGASYSKVSSSFDSFTDATAVGAFHLNQNIVLKTVHCFRNQCFKFINFYD